MDYVGKIIPTPTNKDDFVFASGCFLTNYLPYDDLDYLLDSEIIDFIEKHKAEIYEDLPAETVYEQIVSLAISITHYKKGGLHLKEDNNVRS